MLQNICAQTFTNIESLEAYERVEAKNQIGNFLNSLLRYPFQSLENKEMGVIIGEIYLNESIQNDSVYIISGISESLNEMFLKSLNITLLNYRPGLEKIVVNNKISFYGIFKIEGNDFEISYKYIPEFLLGPLNITVSNTIKSESAIDPILKYKAKPDSYFKEKLKELLGKNRDAELRMNSFSYLKQKKENILIKKRYKQSLSILNTLIGRNPFNAKFFMQRAEIFEKTGGQEKAARDYEFIISFIADENYKVIAKDKLGR